MTGKIVFDIRAEKFIAALAMQLKQIPEFVMPDWAKFVKTSVSKERPPTKEDWWHVRAASILRQVYFKRIVGINKLRTKYGSKKDRGAKPSKFYKGSGKIIRVILQQAEKAGFIEKVKEKKAGRKLTQKGKEFLDSVANK